MTILNLFPRAAEMLSSYRERTRIAAELNAYSDRELTDLGISRSDISGIARRAAR